MKKDQWFGYIDLLTLLATVGVLLLGVMRYFQACSLKSMTYGEGHLYLLRKVWALSYINIGLSVVCVGYLLARRKWYHLLAVGVIFAVNYFLLEKIIAIIPGKG